MERIKSTRVFVLYTWCSGSFVWAVKTEIEPSFIVTQTHLHPTKFKFLLRHFYLLKTRLLHCNYKDVLSQYILHVPHFIHHILHTASWQTPTLTWQKWWHYFTKLLRYWVFILKSSGSETWPNPSINPQGKAAVTNTNTCQTFMLKPQCVVT